MPKTHDGPDLAEHYTKWDARFFSLALHIARWSKDPHEKVGAVIVGDTKAKIALGYNGFPGPIADTQERLQHKSVKKSLMQHAERNAMDNAPFSLVGSALYVTKPPCLECAKSMIQLGIHRLIIPEREIEECVHSLLKEALIDIRHLGGSFEKCLDSS